MVFLFVTLGIVTLNFHIGFTPITFIHAILLFLFIFTLTINSNFFLLFCAFCLISHLITVPFLSRSPFNDNFSNAWDGDGDGGVREEKLAVSSRDLLTEGRISLRLH